jgi:hypothetical protein
MVPLAVRAWEEITFAYDNLAGWAVVAPTSVCLTFGALGQKSWMLRRGRAIMPGPGSWNEFTPC